MYEQKNKVIVALPCVVKGVGAKINNIMYFYTKIMSIIYYFCILNSRGVQGSQPSWTGD